MANDFIPNSYQTPNAYCDRLMYLLTPPEWKILSYAVRRIFGFHKRQDHISLSQFVHGTLSSSGEALDHGTGLSKPTVMAGLDNLMRYRLIVKIADSDPVKKEGDLYALQLDYDGVDYAGLIERANVRLTADLQRTAAGRNGADKKRLSLPLELPELVNGIDRSLVNGIDRSLVNGIDRSLVNGIDRSLVNGIDPQNTVGNPEEIQRKEIAVQRGNPECDPSLTQPLPGHERLTPELVWSAALGELQLEMTRATYETWVKPAVLLSVNGAWKIGAPTSYTRDWLEQRLRPTIARILSAIAGQPVEPEFVVVPSVPGETPRG